LKAAVIVCFYMDVKKKSVTEVHLKEIFSDSRHQATTASTSESSQSIKTTETITIVVTTE